MNKKYLIGKIFGRLTATEQLGAYHRCVCECGAGSIVRTDKLKDGTTKSCGCLARELAESKHREAISRKKLEKTERDILKAKERADRAPSKEEKKLHAVWSAMMQRCYNKNNADYGRYGARGISVCLSWHNRDSFIRDMLPVYRKGCWLERTDNDLGYSKENCEFATAKKQGQNRRNTLYVWWVKKGVDKSLSHICRIHRIAYNSGYKWFWDLKVSGVLPTLELFHEKFKGVEGYKYT